MRAMREIRHPRLALLSAAVTLAVLVPFYYVIAFATEHWHHVAPEMAIDRVVPLAPAWMLVYGSIWVFMLLPFLVVREDALAVRMLMAYITVVVIAFSGFLLVPTLAPRPESVPHAGFFAWALRQNYAWDPPYNCFPSLHVAWAFVTASVSFRVHRGVGWAAGLWASLIGLSTLFTKQHYVVDVVAGALAAWIAYRLWLEPYPASATPQLDRARAPKRASWVVGFYGLMLTVSWFLYRF